MNKFLAVFLVVFFHSSPASALVIEICGHSAYECNSPGGTYGVASGDDLSAIDTSSVGEVEYLQLQKNGSGIAIPVQDSVLHPTAIVPVPVVTPPLVVPSHYLWSRSGVFTSLDYCSGVSAWINYMYKPSDPYNWFLDSCAGEPSSMSDYTATWHYSENGISYPFNHNNYSFTRTNIPDSCPSGSTLVSGACVVNNPYAFAVDNRRDYTRSGQVYSPISGDLVGTITGIQGTTSTSNDSLSFVGSNNANEPTSITSVANVGGGTTITQTTQKTDSGGSSYLKVSSLTTDSGGMIVSRSSANFSGSLNTGASNSAGGAATVAAPSGSLSAAPGAGGSTFPGDYARSGEAAAAMGTVNSAVTTTGTVADPVEPLVADMPGWGNTFDNLTGWSLPAHSSACPQPSMDLSNVLGAGSVYTMSAHCDLFNGIAPTFSAVMMVVWSILALFLVLGA